MKLASLIRSDIDFQQLTAQFRDAKPFNHIVIDDFFIPEVAASLAAEFPAFDLPIWAEYKNAIEVKKVCNHWDRFPLTTYYALNYLNSDEFVAKMHLLVGDKLYSDPGLHGGGWHTHKQGGKLNTHLDYSIHPKLGKERRLNLIVYLTPDWKPEWKGSLGLWAADQESNQPGELVKQVECQFNRAIIFDTSQQSWHGLPEAITCPEPITRNSLAVYYLCDPRANASARGKALFAPFGDQANDPKVLELIKLRSQVQSSASVYREKERKA